MPKRLSADEQADPVRSRLEKRRSEEASRISTLASRAAAPATLPRQPSTQIPQEKARETPSEPQEAKLPEQGVSKDGASFDFDHGAATAVRKARFTPAEALANGEILRLLARLTGSKPSESGITRVLWALLREAEAGLKQQGRRGTTFRRPPNGSSIEMATYERDLGRFILAALKSLEI